MQHAHQSIGINPSISPSLRRYHLFLTVLVLPLLATLCLAHPALSHSRALKIVSPWELKSLDPTKTGNTFLDMEIIETLVSVDRQGNPAPGLATAWTTSEDGLQWKFTLRKNVKFHNGSTMTPEGAANALNIAWKKPGMLKKAPITSIRSEADSILFTLEEPFAILDAILTHYTTCILAPASYTETGDVKKLIATGPYKLLYLKAPQELQTRAFKQYWGKKPQVQAAHYLAVSRNETRALMAQSGDADIVYTLDPITIKRLQRFKRISTFSTPLPRTVMIKLNCALPGLNSPQLRKALSNGLERQGISLTVMRLNNAAALQLFPKSMGAWHVAALNEQPDKSPTYKSLMQAKGWSENNEGYLEKDGDTLELTLKTYSDRPELPVTAAALQDQFRKMGMKLNVSITSSSAIPQGHKDGSLEMGLLARNYGMICNPLGSILQDYSENGGDWGAMNWTSAEMQKLLAESKKAADPERQQAIAQQISTLINNEMPTIPVVFYMKTAAITEDVGNFSLDPLERSFRISEIEWGHN